MNAIEAKRKLCDIRASLNDTESTKAIWIAIRTIDTCVSNGYDVVD